MKLVSDAAADASDQGKHGRPGEHLVGKQQTEVGHRVPGLAFVVIALVGSSLCQSLMEITLEVFLSLNNAHSSELRANQRVDRHGQPRTAPDQHQYVLRVLESCRQQLLREGHSGVLRCGSCGAKRIQHLIHDNIQIPIRNTVKQCPELYSQLGHVRRLRPATKMRRQILAVRFSPLLFGRRRLLLAVLRGLLLLALLFLLLHRLRGDLLHPSLLSTFTLRLGIRVLAEARLYPYNPIQKVKKVIVQPVLRQLLTQFFSPLLR
mmetsp:Transcript_17778/g.39155  ORF Transcript_17778/g.39155 Transcript_17778/m.39155 type:complete len:263 (+) Transcript_17778:1180-1968(+)